MIKMDLEDPKYWKLLVNQSLLKFFLLKSLEKKKIHGYILQTALTVISNGLCKPSQGTIYPALNELEDQGYVTGQWEKVKNRRRKVYILTSKGKRALAVASEILKKALGAVSEQREEISSLPFEKDDSEEKAKLPIKL